MARRRRALGLAAPASVFVVGLLLGPAATGTLDDEPTAVPLLAVLAWAGHGFHRDLVAVVDGCVPATDGPALRSGVPASRLPSLDEWLPRPGPPVWCGLLGEVEGQVKAAYARTVAALRREPTNTVVFTSGQGDRCRESLPGADTPGLAYLLLGALRGWRDGDGDGLVTASEALRGVETILRALPVTTPPAPSYEARGADLILAEAAYEVGPRIADFSRGSKEPAVDEVPVTAFVVDDMIRVDRGFFTLGCRSRRDPQCEADERPPVRIFLNAFAIDRREVTWSEYEECVDAGGCAPIETAGCEVWTGDGFERGAPLPRAFRGPRRPVVCATWEHARAYCAWAGKRLPTEAEWERAARGRKERTLYPWGDERVTCARANVHGCGDATTDVGTHPGGRSPEGVDDLAGNVAEWVADWYHPRTYRKIPRHNPAGAAEGRVRVVRGGSFYELPEYVRVSYRYGLTPTWGYGFVGFRCAR